MELQKHIKDNNTGQTYWEAYFKVILPRALTENEYAMIEQVLVKVISNVLNPEPKENGAGKVITPDLKPKK